MLGTLADVFTWLVAHGDLFTEIYDAIKGGTPKDAIRAAVRQAKVTASDAQMKAELGLPEGTPQ